MNVSAERAKKKKLRDIRATEEDFAAPFVPLNCPFYVH